MVWMIGIAHSLEEVIEAWNTADILGGTAQSAVDEMWISFYTRRALSGSLEPTGSPSSSSAANMR